MSTKANAMTVDPMPWAEQGFASVLSDEHFVRWRDLIIRGDLRWTLRRSKSAGVFGKADRFVISCPNRWASRLSFITCIATRSASFP